ncbi:MAG: hypothetical protein ACO2ZJ_08560, partial [Pseudohongiellaceae bacterium]
MHNSAARHVYYRFDFEAQLLTYVDHLGLSTSYAAKLKAAISAHEYTYARGRLAGSVPSKP